MVSHVDHTEHDVMVIVTEQGLADLRGLSPKQRAREDHRPLRASGLPPTRCRTTSTAPAATASASTPRTCCREALSWHQRCLETGTMRAG